MSGENMERPEGNGGGFAHPYRIMIGLYLGAFVGMFGETAMNIAMPQLSEAFAVPVSMMQWMVIGHMLVIGIIMPFASLLMKRYPVRNLALFSIACFCIGCLISGFALNFPMLIIGRMVQGLGPGLILPIMFAMVVRVFPANKIGTAMGFCSLIIMFAPAVGPTLAGLIMGALSWRWVFFLFAAILVVAFVLAACFLVSPYTLTHPRIDALSCLLSVIGFSGLIMGTGLASQLGWTSPVIVGLLAIGIAGIACYVRRQMHMDTPVLNMRCFGIPGFRAGTMLVMLVFGVNLSAMFLLPQFLQNGIGLSVAVAGIALLPGGIANCLISLVSGKLYDRIGPKVPVLVGLCFIGLGASLTISATSSSAVWFVILCHVVILVGVPLAMSPSQSTALSALPPELSTDGSAILNTLQQVWGAVCTAIVTSLLGIGQASYAGANPADAFTYGVHFGMVFILVLVVVALIIAVGLKKPVPREAASVVARSFEPSPVAGIMKPDVYTISKHATLIEALRYIVGKGISGAPVVDDTGKPVGFISDGDILRYLANADPLFAGPYSFIEVSENREGFKGKLEDLVNLTVEDAATKSLVTIEENDPLDAVSRVLHDKHLKKVPVMKGGVMVGMLNRCDLMRYALEMFDGVVSQVDSTSEGLH